MKCRIPAAFVPDHEETIQEAEAQRWHGKEIKGGDRLPMIGKERKPAFGGSPRRGRRRRRYRATVRSEIAKPSFRSSPWIFGAPQSAFSIAMRRTRVRISSLTFGRPPRGRDRQRQYMRKPARCHPTTVSGFTMTRTSDHRGQMRRKSGPEEPVETVEGWSRPFSFEDGNLLAKREYLKSGTGARANEDADCGHKCRNQVQHESTVLTSRNVSGGPLGRA